MKFFSCLKLCSMNKKMRKIVGVVLSTIMIAQPILWSLLNRVEAAPIHQRSWYSSSEDGEVKSYDFLNLSWKTWNFKDNSLWNYSTRHQWIIKDYGLTSKPVDWRILITSKLPVIEANKRYKIHKIDIEGTVLIPWISWRWVNSMQSWFVMQSDMEINIWRTWDASASREGEDLNWPIGNRFEKNSNHAKHKKMIMIPEVAWNVYWDPYFHFRYKNEQWDKVFLMFPLPNEEWTKKFHFILNWTKWTLEFDWKIYNFDISEKDFLPWYTISNYNSFIHHETWNTTGDDWNFDLEKYNIELQELGSIKITSEISTDLSKNEVSVFLFWKKQTEPIYNNKKINTLYETDWVNISSVNQLFENGYVVASNQSDLDNNIPDWKLTAHLFNSDLSYVWKARFPWKRGFYTRDWHFSPSNEKYNCETWGWTFYIPWKEPYNIKCYEHWSTMHWIGIEQLNLPWMLQYPRMLKTDDNSYYVAWFNQYKRFIANSTEKYLNYKIIPKDNAAIFFFSNGYYYISNMNSFSWDKIDSDRSFDFGNIEGYFKDGKAWTNTYQFLGKKWEDKVQVNVMDLENLPTEDNPNQHLKEQIILWEDDNFNLPWLKAINGYWELMYSLQEIDGWVKVSLWKLRNNLKKKPVLLDAKFYDWMTTTGKNYIKHNALYFALENPSTEETKIIWVGYLDLSQVKIDKSDKCDENHDFVPFEPQTFMNAEDNGKKMCYRVLDVYGNYKYVASPVISGLWPKQIEVKVNKKITEQIPTEWKEYYQKYKVWIKFEDNKTYPDTLKVSELEVDKNVDCNTITSWTNTYEIDQETIKKYEVDSEEKNNKKLCFKIENVYWETHVDEVNYPYLIDTTKPIVSLKTNKVEKQLWNGSQTINLYKIISWIVEETEKFEEWDKEKRIVFKNITDSNNIIELDYSKRVFTASEVWKYKFEIYAIDKAWNVSIAKVVEFEVKENDKTELQNLLTTIDAKLTTPKLINNQAKQDLESYKTTITKAIANKNLTLWEIQTIKETAQEKINALVIDDEAPKMVFKELNPTLEIWDTFNPYKWLTTTDNYDKFTQDEWNTKTKVTFNPDLNTLKVWEIIATYEVQDSNWNKTTLKRKINIQEVDKTKAKKCISKIEKFKKDNSDSIMPSLNAIIDNFINKQKDVINNQNAKKEEVNKICDEINKFINDFDTNYPKPILNSTIKELKVFVGNTPHYTGIVSAKDKIDWDLTWKVLIDKSKVNTKVVWKYTIEYSVSNSKGRKAILNLPLEVLEEKTTTNSSWGSGKAKMDIYTPNTSTTIEKIEIKKDKNVVHDNKKDDGWVISILNNNKTIPEKKSDFQSKSHEKAYKWALKNKIIDKKTFPSSEIYNNLTRWELAVIVANFSKKLEKPKKFTKQQCSKFSDLNSVENPVIKDGMIRACEYGLMGIHSNWKTQIDDFMNKQLLRRADLATVVSRMFWGTKYDDETLRSKYWLKHLQHLSEENIIKIPDPEIKEIKEWVLLMLKRYDK